MSLPFNSVLVANRGEIAVRVIRSLRDLGLRSIAVFSEVDRHALHVRMADEAYPIGPAPSDQSYLHIERVLEAARTSGAQAIHPGYGFLSENPEFAEACVASGLVWIGPPPSAIRVMGSKMAARGAMERAGVPVVPGAHASTAQEIREAAQVLGYPVMLKASLGGGGKGMRLVREADEVGPALERAQSEALNAFGDATVYVEKAIDKPRHIEIQVLADHHGNVVHLFERDCSIQRRHQKIVEETPSPCPHIDRSLVARMGDVAVRAADSIGYASAGTVEFLVDCMGNFFFLEMNTRLQVEHPITELVTGFDLVAEQVHIAAGRPLALRQPEITRRGHAIECRIYAEDPKAGFLPSPGTVDTLRVPTGPWVRDDSSIYAGAEVSSHYDPLISKLCVWAPNRAQALERMRRALWEYVVTGVQTNLSFHMQLMNHPSYRDGVYDTEFVERHPELAEPTAVPADDRQAVIVAAAAARAFEDQETRTPDGATRPFSAWRQHFLREP